MPRKIITEELKQEIIKYYLSQPMTLKQVGDKYELSNPTIIKILKDVPKYSKAKLNNPNMKEHFFQDINEEVKAYFLGLLISDGNVFKDGTGRQASISITLDLKDEYMLEKFKEAVLNFLKHKNCYEKINFLQDTRYLLEEEAFAYSEEVKYARKLKDMGYDISIDNLCNFNYIYYFKEKAEVLKELAFEIITKKRKQIALQNKKM